MSGSRSRYFVDPLYSRMADDLHLVSTQILRGYVGNTFLGIEPAGKLKDQQGCDDEKPHVVHPANAFPVHRCGRSLYNLLGGQRLSIRCRAA